MNFLVDFSIEYFYKALSQTVKRNVFKNSESILMDVAPIALFVYNRLRHTQRTVEALLNNSLAKDSELIVFSDGPKDVEASVAVQQVRNYIKTVTGFKSVSLVERNQNEGLASNIVDGVTNVVNQYGKVIVMEDDIVTSPMYLNFMNQALDFFENEKKVWHVSGWNYPVGFNELGDAFLWRGMNCWGWATWADRWQYFEKNPKALINDWSAEERSRFDLDGSGIFWNQIEANAKGKINTWAIFWYATIFQNQGLCLNPSISYVDNIGHDGTGEHCGVGNSHSVSFLNEQSDIALPTKISEDSHSVSEIKKFSKNLKKPFVVRVVNKIGRTIMDRNLLK
jgi:hypothetical protein